MLIKKNVQTCLSNFIQREKPMADNNIPAQEYHSEYDVQISRIHTVYYGCQTNWSRPKIMPRYTNGFICFCVGSIRYEFECGSILAKPGDILFFPKGMQYAGVSLSDANSFFVIDFDTSNNISYISRPIVFHPKGSELQRSFSQIAALWNDHTLSSLLQCRARIYDLLSLILPLQEDLSAHSDLFFVNQVCSYIRTRYMQSDLYVRQIAEHMNISESQLRRRFQKVSHQTPLEYLLGIRISHAKELLLYSQKSISEIADACGFSSYYYFCRVFKRQTGITPSAFRKL